MNRNELELSDDLPKLLQRQIKRATKLDGSFDYNKFIELVRESYDEAERTNRLNKNAMQLMSREMTDQYAALKDLTDDIIKAKKMAEDANLLKTEFLANITHELKTPVHCIINFAQIGLADYKKNRIESIKEHFEDIFSNGQRLDALISDLLDISKIETGNMDFYLDMYPVRGMLENSISFTRGIANEKNITTDIIFDSDCDEHVLVDARRMEQVLINLMSNAIRFSPENGKIIWRVSSAVMAICVSDIFVPAIAMTIQDEGVGIPEEERGSMFNHFTQGKEARLKGGGTGLGLTICRQLLQTFHGTISIKDSKKAGAVFEIVLPLWHNLGLIGDNANGE